jgi:hypothetical protein
VDADILPLAQADQRRGEGAVEVIAWPVRPPTLKALWPTRRRISSPVSVGEA